MSLVRMNITIPEDLAHQIDRLVGPRKKSRFISEALKRRLEEIEREKLQQALDEGYKARKEENQSLAKEFESIDLEGWDEY
jgi:metal-responsive CopG/Arc/MetJ family transcriptional regulator